MKIEKRLLPIFYDLDVNFSETLKLLNKLPLKEHGIYIKLLNSSFKTHLKLRTAIEEQTGKENQK